MAKVREIDPSIKELVKQNGGYCPCMVEKTPDTKCPCRDFREMESGVCHCGRFEKEAERRVVVGGIYRHFQGGDYMVIGVAEHTNTQEVLVVYMPMSDDVSTWAMPYDEFLSEVDRKKYPGAQQDYQFEPVEDEE